MNALPAHADLQPTPAAIEREVLVGLARKPKRLPSKYFYDARGSRLFEAITQQPEYYLTRVEMALFEARAGAIRAAVGRRAHVVEYGSGSGRKTDLLLEALDDPVAYTPIEISRTALLESVAALRERHAGIEMLPVCADFMQPFELPATSQHAERTLVFFPGSTLGNFEAADAVTLLRGMARAMGGEGLALIGIDLVKDAVVLDAAYNDAAGVTADFTLNLLARLNREIGSDFDLAGFKHHAQFVREASRIETYLVATRAQSVRVAGRAFPFAADEAMLVELSHKYTDAAFGALAANAGLEVMQCWNAPADAFGLRLLRRTRLPAPPRAPSARAFL